ncbi:Uma2 family endonuclease [Nocardia goodfellowii]|uniref:Uma2 family endonuclease n=1 Tax=Nocardia goodfellowii TaxID=882446 RepID=A0ABS4Q8R4_9NOCA|nr:Uma2 family endonuclease [Nocardia goodfellowii]
MVTVVHWPDHLLTLDDWIALPEDNSRHYELAEGVLVVCPRPILRHQAAIVRLGAQLESQLPPAWATVSEAELVVDPSPPATVRVPDIMVVHSSAVERNLPRVTPDDVLLAVEIISPGTKRTDRRTKFDEYAEVGIEYYWIVDLDDPVSLSAYRLIAGEYEQVGERTGDTSMVLDGMSVALNLTGLVRGRE